MYIVDSAYRRENDKTGEAITDVATRQPATICWPSKYCRDCLTA